MKRLLFLFAALTLLLTACGTGSTIPETSNGESGETIEPSTNEPEAEAEQKEEKDTAGTEEQAAASEQEPINLNDYRPSKDEIRTYVQDDFQITYEVVDQNDQYVQESVKFGDISSQHIYQWNEEGFSIVYSEENPQDEGSIIENFKPVESPKEAVSINSQGDGESGKWDVTALEEELSVPYDTFHDVLMAKKTVTSETSGQKTSTTRYFARNIGLIKEVIEVDGENGYMITTELEEITDKNE